MAPRGCRKINFSGLPADLQGLVVSKMAAAEAANLAATSREMREVCAAPLGKIKRARAADAEAIWVLPEIINRSFQSPQPQHVTHGKYTISTTEASGPSPYYFHVTVASDEMSVEFTVWGSDIRFQQPMSRPVISRSNMTIGGKKKRFVPKSKKFDSIRKEVADITSCLKLTWVYHL
jgi:hypothetical protein